MTMISSHCHQTQTRMKTSMKTITVIVILHIANISGEDHFDDGAADFDDYADIGEEDER